MAKAAKERCRKPTAGKYNYDKSHSTQAMQKNAQLESTRYGWSARLLVEKN